MKTHKNKKPRNSNDILPPLWTYLPTGIQLIEGEHPAMLSDEALLKDVVLDFGRSSGPGGQHRNRKATSCTATHKPSDFSGEATERRRQSENRKLAISRLRRTLAIHLRRSIDKDSYRLSELWEARRQGTLFAINPKHRDYPHILAEVLDILFAFNFDQIAASTLAQISSTQLLKIIAHDKAAFTWFNDQRKDCGLQPLKA